MSVVAFQRLRAISPEGIEVTVREVVARVAPSEADVGADALLKLNAMSDEFFPGRNTSPWLLDAALAVLRERYPRARWTIVDTDVAGSRQFERACRAWGYDAIAARHGVTIRNLSTAPTVRRKTANPHVSEIELPRIVVEASCIVNLPVLKTHVLSGITCALKNHWGLLPRVRYRFHPVVHEVIAEINRQIPQTALTVVDGTVCIEGSGPKTGVPRIANVVLGSRDRVAVDTAVLDFIGMPRSMAPHVALAEALGVGITDYLIEGDPFVTEHFALPNMSSDVVSWLEKRIRAMPVVGPAFYWPPIALVLGQIGTQYNKRVWMNVHGRRHLHAIRRHPDYGRQFGSVGG